MAAKIKRGDKVLIIAGKDRGKTGKVLRVLPREGRVIVEGINMIKRHVRRRTPAIQAGIITREAPIHISKVMFLCNKCGKPTRIGFRLLAEGKVRFCCRCQEVME